MKVLILAGGFGTRFGEETSTKPKPMIEIGGKPIIWHIMKIYAHAGFNDFIILLGYKGEIIKQYFDSFIEPEWKVKLLDTGEGILKSQRIKRAEQYIEEENFFLAYGDDLSDVSPKRVLEAHMNSNNIVTLTAIPLVSNFGVLELNNDNQIERFREKPRIENHWINGGFFCLSKKIFNYMDDTNLELENEIFAQLANENKIGAMTHEGFWKSMNTYKDKLEIDVLINENKAKWIKW